MWSYQWINCFSLTVRYYYGLSDCHLQQYHTIVLYNSVVLLAWNKCKIYGSKLKISQFQVWGHKSEIEKVHLKWEGTYHETSVCVLCRIRPAISNMKSRTITLEHTLGNASHIVCPNPLLGQSPHVNILAYHQKNNFSFTLGQSSMF